MNQILKSFVSSLIKQIITELLNYANRQRLDYNERGDERWQNHPPLFQPGSRTLRSLRFQCVFRGTHRGHHCIVQRGHADAGGLAEEAGGERTAPELQQNPARLPRILPPGAKA